MLGKIIQPTGIKYLIQDLHYNKGYAQEYIDMLIDMLIEKMEEYIELKRSGRRAAPLMTLEQMEVQLANIKKFQIVEVA